MLVVERLSSHNKHVYTKLQPSSVQNASQRAHSLKNKTPPKNKPKQIGQFILGDTIGSGTFGTVRIATHCLTNEKVAVKVLDKVRILEEINKTRFEREIKILKLLHHRNLIQLYSVIQNSTTIYLIMEYAEGDELFDYINNKKRLSETEACRFYQQMISGIEYLHKIKVVHRDLKPENLLLDNNHNLKIVDFGLSNVYPIDDNGLLSTACGSPCYAAPEMIQGKKYIGVNVDIWSSGIILYAMLCGYLPFEEKSNDLLYKKITKGEFVTPFYLSDSAKDLLRKVLNVNPEKRLDIEGIKNHEWFNIINPKPNLSEGLLIEKVVIPVDEDILKEMKKFGYKINDVRINVLYNKHNHITTTYYLILRQKVRSCIPSIADLKSRLFKEYINNENNLLEKYGNSIENYISTIKKDEIEKDNNEGSKNDTNSKEEDNNAQCVKKDKDDNKSNKHNTMSKQIENPPLSYREKPSITMSLPTESNNAFKTYERNEETTTIDTLTTTTNNNNIKRDTSNNKYVNNQKMKKLCKTIFPSSHKNPPKYQIITNNNTISTSYHKHNSTRAFHRSKHSKPNFTSSSINNKPSSTLPTEPNSNNLQSISSKRPKFNNSMKIIKTKHNINLNLKNSISKNNKAPPLTSRPKHSTNKNKIEIDIETNIIFNKILCNNESLHKKTNKITSFESNKGNYIYNNTYHNYNKQISYNNKNKNQLINNVQLFSLKLMHTSTSNKHNKNINFKSNSATSSNKQLLNNNKNKNTHSTNHSIDNNKHSSSIKPYTTSTNDVNDVNTKPKRFVNTSVSFDNGCCNNISHDNNNIHTEHNNENDIHIYKEYIKKKSHNKRFNIVKENDDKKPLTSRNNNDNKHKLLSSSITFNTVNKNTKMNCYSQVIDLRCLIANGFGNVKESLIKIFTLLRIKYVYDNKKGKFSCEKYPIKFEVIIGYDESLRWCVLYNKKISGSFDNYSSIIDIILSKINKE